MSALFSILASAFVGLSDVLGGRLAVRRTSAEVTALQSLVALPVIVCAGVILGADHVLRADLLLAVVPGVLSAVGYIGFYTALANGSVAIVVPVSAAVTVLTPVVVGLVGGDSISAYGWCGAALCVIAVPLCCIEPGDLRPAAGAVPRTPRPHWRAPNQAALAALTGVGFGSFYVVMGNTSTSSGVWPAAVVVAVAAAVTGAVVVVSRAAPARGPSPVPAPPADRPGQPGDVRITATTLLVVSGTALGLADVLNTVALQIGPLSTAAVLGNLYPLFAVVVARLLFRDRLGGTQVLGLALGVVGAVALTATT